MDKMCIIWHRGVVFRQSIGFTSVVIGSGVYQNTVFVFYDNFFDPSG